jgi:hypothetical protein
MIEYSIQGKDGLLARVKDFLFDDQGWILRYLDVDFSDLPESGRVLVPVSKVESVDWNKKLFRSDIDRKRVQTTPGRDEKLPVSREYEEKLNKHYNLDAYWPFAYHAAVGLPPLYPPRPLRVPAGTVDENELESHLRSFLEVKEYRIRARDKSLGEVSDLIVDDEDWQVVYLIMDTSRLLPWSKHVILSVDWLSSISFSDMEIATDLTTEQIKNAPEYNPGHPVDMDYEQALNEYYTHLFQQA